MFSNAFQHTKIEGNLFSEVYVIGPLLAGLPLNYGFCMCTGFYSLFICCVRVLSLESKLELYLDHFYILFVLFRTVLSDLSLFWSCSVLYISQCLHLVATLLSSSLEILNIFAYKFTILLPSCMCISFILSSLVCICTVHFKFLLFVFLTVGIFLSCVDYSTRIWEFLDYLIVTVFV